MAIIECAIRIYIVCVGKLSAETHGNKGKYNNILIPPSTLHTHTHTHKSYITLIAYHYKI